MKKLLAIAIAAAMLLTLSVTCFAANPIETNGGTDTHDVTGVFVQPTEKAVYVTISWGDMKFKYTPTTQVWDHEQHIWKDGAADEGVWAPVTAGQNTVKVQNDSSCAVSAAFSYAKTAGYEGVAASFDKASFDLEAPVYNNASSHPSDTATVSLSGSINGDVATETTMGTITVTINAK